MQVSLGQLGTELQKKEVELEHAKKDLHHVLERQQSVEYAAKLTCTGPYSM